MEVLILKNKLYLVPIIILIFAITTISSAAPNSEIKVYVNAIQMSFPDQKPIINSENRTLVPVRFVSQVLGATVDWNDQTKQVTIQHEGKTIILEIGKKQAQVGESTITLDTFADIVNSRTMVPLRFISECMGAEVQWNGEKKEIYISTKMPPANPFIGQPFKPSDLPCVGGISNGSVIYGSDKAGSKIMYAELSHLPIKVGEHIIYSVSVDSDNINITQHTENINYFPILMYMVESGQLTRYRGYYANEKGSTFKHSYSIISTLDDTPTDITKISDFALFTYENSEFRILVIPNPAYKG